MSDTAVHGMNSVVLMDDTSLRELGTSVRTPLSRQDVDVSVFGMVDMESISGMRNGALNFEGIRKGELAPYLRMCRSAIGQENTNHMLTYGPDGYDVGMQAFLINSNQNSFEVNSPYAGAVMISAVFAATGGPRFGVFLSAAHGSTPVTSSMVQRITLTNKSAGNIVLSATDDLGDAIIAPTDSDNAVQSDIEAMFAEWSGNVTVIGNITHNGVNEVQTVQRGLSGTGSLEFSSQVTVQINYNATPSTIQGYLEGLSNVAPGDITVDEPVAGTLRFTFGGAYIHTNVSQIVPSGTGFGAAATTTQGAAATAYNGYWDVVFDSDLGNVPALTTATPNVTITTISVGGIDYNLQVRSATGNGAAHDGGAATSNGYTLHFHNIYVASTTASLIVRFQDSADGVTWATVASFNAVSLTGKQRITHKTATVRRYTRVRWEISGTNPGFAFAVAMSRHGNIKWAG